MSQIFSFIHCINVNLKLNQLNQFKSSFIPFIFLSFCVAVQRYFLGMSDSIFPSVLVGPLQQVMHWLPESRHRKLANIAENLKHQFHELLGTNGVFLYPTFPTTAHRHYQIYHKLVDTGYMMVFNTIGLPVTNCMVRLDRHKLPIGIQVHLF